MLSIPYQLRKMHMLKVFAGLKYQQTQRQDNTAKHHIASRNQATQRKTDTIFIQASTRKHHIHSN